MSRPFATVHRRHMLGATVAWGLSPTLSARTSDDLQALPEGPFRLVLGTTAGGTMDSLARLLARHMSSLFNKTFLVENRPGANGVLAAEWVAQSRSYGVNMFVGLSSQLLLNQLLYKRLPIDLRTDLTRIYQLSSGALYLAINPKRLPVQALSELLNHARLQPRKLTYASMGPGSYTHLMGERLNQLMDQQLVHVPYKGETQMTQALLAGEVDLSWASAQQFFQYPNQLQALASSGSTRMLSGLPAVPTFAEAGMPDEAFSMHVWAGIAMSSQTAPRVRNAVAAAIAYTLQSSGLAAQSAAIRAPLILDSSPSQFEAIYQSEYPKWERLVREVGVSLD